MQRLVAQNGRPVEVDWTPELKAELYAAMDVVRQSEKLITCWKCLNVCRLNELVPAKKIRKLSKAASRKHKSCPKCSKRVFITGGGM